MSSFIGLAARALLLPGVLDLRSSSKKKTPKLKFPERKFERLYPLKVYTKGSGTRKVND
jgi:hypothetical protein